jgi:large subunit ribosomal protein L4
MTQVNVYNAEGKTSKTLELNEAVFAVPLKTSLIHQVYQALRANLRSPWADTKDKGEVRGGGKKPWKQKGTGRARHGSIRSPIWKGGGVTFGPLSVRTYKQKINKKMNQNALVMSLSEKLRSDEFVVLEDLTSTGKTREMAALRKALPGVGKTTLFLLPSMKSEIVQSIKNLPNCEIKQAVDVNVMDLLHHKYIIASIESVHILEKRLA